MGSPWMASARELRAAPEMQDGFLGLADALHERRQCHVAVVSGLEREARLDVALRLAPELLAHAQLAQREKERGDAESCALRLRLTRCAARSTVAASAGPTPPGFTSAPPESIASSQRRIACSA